MNEFKLRYCRTIMGQPENLRRTTVIYVYENGIIKK